MTTTTDTAVAARHSKQSPPDGLGLEDALLWWSEEEDRREREAVAWARTQKINRAAVVDVDVSDMPAEVRHEMRRRGSTDWRWQAAAARAKAEKEASQRASLAALKERMAKLTPEERQAKKDESKRRRKLKRRLAEVESDPDSVKRARQGAEPAAQSTSSQESTTMRKLEHDIPTRKVETDSGKTLIGAAREKRDKRIPNPGSKLTHEREGKTAECIVKAEGFEYKNKLYGSLTGAAKAAAEDLGTWTRDGFAFWGLREKPKTERKPRAKKTEAKESPKSDTAATA